MIVGLIGHGAIAQYVLRYLDDSAHDLAAILLRPERQAQAGSGPYVYCVEDLPDTLDLVVDCAGHAALATYGAPILKRGMDVATVSLGALADADLYDSLQKAALAGQGRLHLASGAIGALDCLQAAHVGGLDRVTYTGRKPPRGWLGSPAENHLDLIGMSSGAAVHFQGTARAAATTYPKNANVAAAVALAGLGFDDTHVTLIADAGVSENIHEIEATGVFGSFSFQIRGRSLPDNPRSSALAAMSVVAKIEQMSNRITI